MTAKELREKRAGLIHQAGALLKKAEDEKRDLTQEEENQWTTLHAEADKLKAQFERMEKQEDLDKEMNESRGRLAGGKESGTENRDTAEELKKKQRDAFVGWLRYGMGGITTEQRQIMAERQESLPQEARAQSIGLDTAGGYLADSEFMAKVEDAMLPYSGIRSTRATIMRTSSGNTIAMPTSDDTSNSGARLDENTQAGEQDMTFGSKNLRAYMYTSKIVRVSLQFLQDSSIGDTEGFIATKLGERIGRITGSEFITGTGNNMPEGLAEGATSAATTASATAITYGELVDLEMSINAAYRRNAEFLFGDGTLTLLKKLKDGEGRPLWVPGIATREPDRILGYKYALDQNIPKPASTTKSIYFGDFSKFIIRDVTGGLLLRLTERYADYLQVGFLLFSRHDSILLDAGTHPIKYLTQNT
jgi:HK97 family phage major capsid protein